MNDSLFKTLTPDFSFNDERGFLFQLCRDGWKQINVSKTIAGTFRGGHYHKNTKEAFFIIDGEVSDKEKLDALATIPSREGLLTMLAAGMMGVAKDLSICLDLYAQQKEEQ